MKGACLLPVRSPRAVLEVPEIWAFSSALFPSTDQAFFLLLLFTFLPRAFLSVDMDRRVITAEKQQPPEHI